MIFLCTCYIINKTNDRKARKEAVTTETRKVTFNGHTAEIIIPDKPNGKWIWKTEFLYAFDKAERALCEEGYTRVYYGISNMYGSPKAVGMMHDFHIFLTEEYDAGFRLDKKAILFGFSRGGLYAFNYALEYPELTAKVYLDAPVLNIKSWPPKYSPEYYDMIAEYSLDEKAYDNFTSSPIDRLPEFFSLGIPVLGVAGLADTVVPYEENLGIMIDYCEKNSLPIKYILKPDCDHHPHSLDDITPIAEFVREE